MNFKKILAPTDFSKASQEGVKMAAQLASVSGGEVVLLFVEEPVPDDNLSDPIKEILATYSQALHTEAEKQLGEMMEKNLAGVQSRFVIGDRHAVESILYTAIREKIDLICMATRGWGQESSSGSITERVVRNSEIPVLVVPSLSS